jgi:hypothetical protein
MTELNPLHTEKKKRSLTLSLKLNGDLEELTEHLGISVHSYMVNELAKAVQRDRLSFQAKNSLEDMMKDFKRIANTQ